MFLISPCWIGMSFGWTVSQVVGTNAINSFFGLISVAKDEINF